MTLSQPTPQRRGEVATFRMIWPVTDRFASFDDLIDEASTVVPALCRRHRVELLGRPRWTLRRGFTIPGSGGAHTVLVAEAPAKPMPRPVEVAA